MGATARTPCRSGGAVLHTQGTCAAHLSGSWRQLRTLPPFLSFASLIILCSWLFSPFFNALFNPARHTRQSSSTSGSAFRPTSRSSPCLGSSGLADSVSVLSRFDRRTRIVPYTLLSLFFLLSHNLISRWWYRLSRQKWTNIESKPSSKENA